MAVHGNKDGLTTTAVAGEAFVVGSPIYYEDGSTPAQEAFRHTGLFTEAFQGLAVHGAQIGELVTGQIGGELTIPWDGTPVTFGNPIGSNGLGGLAEGPLSGEPHYGTIQGFDPGFQQLTIRIIHDWFSSAIPVIP